MKSKMRRLFLGAGLLTIMLSLAACAPAVTGVTPPSTANTSAATPTPTQTATAVPTGALTCDSIITAPALSAALGVTVTAQATPLDIVSLAPQIYNGITCVWAGKTGGYVNLVAFGANSGLTPSKDETNCFGVDKPTKNEYGECRFDKASGQFWLSGTVETGAAGTNALAQKAMSATLAGFTSAAATATAPEAPSVQTDVWPIVPCSKLSTAGKVKTAVSAPTLTAQESDNSPAELPDGYYAAIGQTQLTACFWQTKTGATPSVAFSSNEFPGAGALLSTIKNAAGVTVIPLPGGSPAYSVPVAGSTPSLWMFVGSNLVTIDGNSGTSESTLERAILALATEFNAS